ncbi:MAG: glycosyltransferase family 2 protein [Synergistaceae bacterium]|nr:glycosyltransferase family 2 protein [Synergistaceae bacterium]
MYDNSRLVSVITPAYNCASTIEDTIRSVLKQTYENWEMLIVDDCSVDDTSVVVEAYTKKDSRIKLIKLEKNSGSAHARNTAIKNAEGRYIAFLDSDDLWKPSKLEKQIAYMESNNFAFTFTAYETFHSALDLRRRVFHVPNSINYEQYLGNSIIGNLTVIMDRAHIKDVHIEKGDLEDVLTWMHYLKSGIIAHGLDENLASYRVAAQSKSGNKIKNAKRFFSCLREEQKLPLVKCIMCEFRYITNALRKRIFGEVVTYNERDGIL